METTNEIGDNYPTIMCLKHHKTVRYLCNSSECNAAESFLCSICTATHTLSHKDEWKDIKELLSQDTCDKISQTAAKLFKDAEKQHEDMVGDIKNHVNYYLTEFLDFMQNELDNLCLASNPDTSALTNKKLISEQDKALRNLEHAYNFLFEVEEECELSLVDDLLKNFIDCYSKLNNINHEIADFVKNQKKKPAQTQVETNSGKEYIEKVKNVISSITTIMDMRTNDLLEDFKENIKAEEKEPLEYSMRALDSVSNSNKGMIPSPTLDCRSKKLRRNLMQSFMELEDQTNEESSKMKEANNHINIRENSRKFNWKPSSLLDLDEQEYNSKRVACNNSGVRNSLQMSKKPGLDELYPNMRECTISYDKNIELEPNYDQIKDDNNHSPNRGLSPQSKGNDMIMESSNDIIEIIPSPKRGSRSLKRLRVQGQTQQIKPSRIRPESQPPHKGCIISSKFVNNRKYNE